eukprot:3349427-Prymnesium_polylepis.1
MGSDSELEHEPEQPDVAPPNVEEEESDEDEKHVDKGAKKKHWSGKRVGEEFTWSFDRQGIKKNKTITVKLRRNSSTSVTESMEPLWNSPCMVPWRPACIPD